MALAAPGQCRRAERWLGLGAPRQRGGLTSLTPMRASAFLLLSLPLLLAAGEPRPPIPADRWSLPADETGLPDPRLVGTRSDRQIEGVAPPTGRSHEEQVQVALRGGDLVAGDALVGDDLKEGLRRLGRRAGMGVALAVPAGVRGVSEGAGDQVNDLHGGLPSGVAPCGRRS